jgi:acyl-CoA hydrolase
VDDLDVTLEVSEQLGSLPRQEPSAAEVAVARNVASVIDDEATLQFGTGNVVDAVLALLAGHKGLGIHSGMVTEGILPLLEKGAIDNRNKGAFDGKTVTGMAGGSDAFRRFIHRNPDFLVVPAAISHGHAVLAQLRRFTTVNSAIEVDLTGQVNAEYMKGSQFSGVGGQADYTFAGSTSGMAGSKAIIAMPAATAGAAVSRVVRQLCPGAIVTTPRYCVDFVVTEYGVADLRFQPLAERAKRLIAVAHPAHRETLEQETRMTSLLD